MASVSSAAHLTAQDKYRQEDDQVEQALSYLRSCQSSGSRACRHANGIALILKQDSLGSDSLMAACGLSRQDKLLVAMALLKLGVLRKKAVLFTTAASFAVRLKLMLGAFGLRAAVLLGTLPRNSRRRIVQARIHTASLCKADNQHKVLCLPLSFTQHLAFFRATVRSEPDPASTAGIQCCSAGLSRRVRLCHAIPKCKRTSCRG